VYLTGVYLTGLKANLLSELSRLSKTVPKGTWGEEYLRQMIRTQRKARPARIYVEGVPAGIRFGAHTTATREDADILSLGDNAAAAALEDGPPDGKPVFIRKSKDSRRLTPDTDSDSEVNTDRYGDLPGTQGLYWWDGTYNRPKDKSNEAHAPVVKLCENIILARTFSGDGAGGKICTVWPDHFDAMFQRPGSLLFEDTRNMTWRRPPWLLPKRGTLKPEL
jgi:hypothetical protein